MYAICGPLFVVCSPSTHPGQHFAAHPTPQGLMVQQSPLGLNCPAPMCRIAKIPLSESWGTGVYTTRNQHTSQRTKTQAHRCAFTREEPDPWVVGGGGRSGHQPPTTAVVAPSEGHHGRDRHQTGTCLGPESRVRYDSAHASESACARKSEHHAKAQAQATHRLPQSVPPPPSRGSAQTSTAGSGEWASASNAKTQKRFSTFIFASKKQIEHDAR